MADQRLEEIADVLPKYTEKVPLEEDKFLFFFKPGRLNSDLFGKYDLVLGVRILGICFILETINALIDSIFPKSLFGWIISVILLILFGISSFYILFCTYNLKPVYLKIAYLFGGALMLLLLTGYTLKTFYKITCFLYPFNKDFLQLNFLIYVFGKGVLVFIYLYLVWILYCYMKRRENGSLSLNIPSENENLLNDNQ